MKDKYLRVTMPDGTQWDVPAGAIAENRAGSFHPVGTVQYADEIETTLKDDFTLMDWAENNMNWIDVKFHAVQVGAPKVDYQAGWVNGPKKVVERE